MAEYIEREAFVEELKEHHDYVMQDTEVSKTMKWCEAVCYGRTKDILETLSAADVEPVRHGWWEWFEEWLPSTTEHPRECEDCGWRCGNCKRALEDMVGGYWDNYDEKPQLTYCPNCGAKMDGGSNG